MTVDEANDRVVKPASFDYFYEETLQLVVDTELSGTCPRTLGTIIIHNIHYKPNFCIQFGAHPPSLLSLCSWCRVYAMEQQL